jgi:threonine aldolase
MNGPIDLRSDTVTRPTPAMRQAMAEAPVGDDQFGEDPTVIELQRRVAALLGQAAALWLPTGTMANQVALRALTRPGDDVVVSRECHAVWHEAGAGAANAGVQFTQIGSGGSFTADELLMAIKPRHHMLYPPTTLVQVENTHNRAGGVVVPQEQVTAVCAVARERGIATFLDGARLWNAAIASGATVAELAAPFDTVSVALSKGLGAPGGSVLAGSPDFIAACVRHRRMLGGAMRQVGILAAAGLHALDHHVHRLVEDHRHARLLADRLAACPGVVLDPSRVATNIVVFGLEDPAPDAARVVARAAALGVLVVPFGPRTVRAVTHLDVSEADCREGAARLAEAIATA